MAVNLSMLKRLIYQAMSEKWAEKLVFPNCQGVSWTKCLDDLDVRRPRVEGILFLTVGKLEGLPEPGSEQFACIQTFAVRVCGLCGACISSVT